MSSGSPTVILVGHCGPDAMMLRSAVSSALPGARVDLVNDGDTLSERAARADLLLINRVLDGDFETDDGVELIRSIKGDGGTASARVMLVSNFEDAQSEAEAAGALPGFGKRDLNTDKAAEAMRSAVGAGG